jgi:hypothetical protein
MRLSIVNVTAGGWQVLCVYSECLKRMRVLFDRSQSMIWSLLLKGRISRIYTIRR